MELSKQYASWFSSADAKFFCFFSEATFDCVFVRSQVPEIKTWCSYML